jgi:hypothetical protein
VISTGLRRVRTGVKLAPILVESVGLKCLH